MYLGQWDVLTEARKLKHNSYELFRGGTSSSTVMVTVVIAIAHVPYQRKKHTH